MPSEKKPFHKEFLAFLREYKIFSLAVAFIIGEASTGLVNSLVRDILLPIAAPLISAETWKEAVLTLGPVTISYGAFVADLVNFVILADECWQNVRSHRPFPLFSRRHSRRHCPTG